jgi:hypothetical protein
MVVSPRVFKNIKHAINLGIKGDELGLELCEDYCERGNDAVKSYVCIALLVHPEYVGIMPCCLKHLDLAIERYRKLGAPEYVITRAKKIIARELGEEEEEQAVDENEDLTQSSQEMIEKDRVLAGEEPESEEDVDENVEESEEPETEEEVDEVEEPASEESEEEDEEDGESNDREESDEPEGEEDDSDYEDYYEDEGEYDEDSDDTEF